MTRPGSLLGRLGSAPLVLAGLLASTSVGACGGGDAARTEPAPAAFVDVTSAAGITFLHQSGASPEKRMVESFGSGVAWIDYDDDGWQDLFFVNGAPGAANVLYRNQGNGTFADVTAASGLAGSEPATSFKTGVAVGDVDQDGRPDLYVTAFGPNTLYRNNGDGTFTDATARAGVAGPETEWSTSAGFADFDRDGDLDLYVANYLDYRIDADPYCGYEGEGYRTYCHPSQFDGMADRMYRNNGDGTFTDTSQAAGVANPSGKGLGVAFCDFDGDADVDVYVANDTVRNFLYRNSGNGTFTDVAYGAGVGFDTTGKPQAGMGTDCADVDGNRLPDLFVTNFSEELNTLYMNRGGGLFEDVTSQVGLATGLVPLGFGTRLFDRDNDGDLDIYVTNGHVIDNISLYRAELTHAQQALLYDNLGGGRFQDVSATSGPALQLQRVGRGLAVADFDNDGQLDLAVSNLGQAPLLLKGQGTAGSWLLIRARGRASNRLGLGARVEVETSAGTQVREINNVASYLSANDLRLHVGLGSATVVRRLEVLWPSGRTQVLADVPVNQVLTIEEP